MGFEPLITLPSLDGADDPIVILCIVIAGVGLPVAAFLIGKIWDWLDHVVKANK